MTTFEAITEKTPDGYRVIFGRRLSDGTFQVSYFKTAAYYKTEKKAVAAANRWNTHFNIK